MNQYKYCERYLNPLLQILKVKNPERYQGSIVAHGDKCPSYNKISQNIGHNRATLIYLLTYIPPFNEESRDTKKGWVDPFVWMMDNKNKFLPIIEKLENYLAHK